MGDHYRQRLQLLWVLITGGGGAGENEGAAGGQIKDANNTSTAGASTSQPAGATATGAHGGGGTGSGTRGTVQAVQSDSLQQLGADIRQLVLGGGMSVEQLVAAVDDIHLPPAPVAQGGR